VQGKAHPSGQGWQPVNVVNPMVLTASHFRQIFKYPGVSDLFPACDEIVNADGTNLDVIFIQQDA
jgi:hypothetical protein